ncbi:MAG: YdcF family protein [Microlunatus sp.]|nr:YdcF family protein [Microlunatus sp.]
MEGSLIDTVLAAAPLVITAVVCWIAIRRTVAEPRRLSNAYWLLVAGLLAAATLTELGFPGLGSFVIVIVLAPVLVLCLTIFLILNGVVMLRRERVTAANLLSLVTGVGLLVIIVGTIPVILSENRWLITTLAIVLILVGYFGFHFVAFLGYALLYPRLVRNQPADWVVILGSGLGGGTRVTPLLASRVRAGMVEFARRGARLLVLSGGRGADEVRAEGAAMAEFAIANGADPGQVVVEDRSRNTRQNLRYSAELVPPGGQGLIVTSNYHTLRAAMLARKVGLPAQASGAPTAGYYWPSAMIREYLAVLAEHRIVHAALVLVVGGPLALLSIIALLAG